MALLLTLLLAAPPVEQGRYLMSLDGVPAGVVTWRLEGGTYTYRSTHVFRARSRVREVVLDERARAGRVPEVLALARLPRPGCVAAVEELTGRPEEVCVDEVEGRAVKGRVGGTAFAATYDADRRLARLETAGAVFTASDGALPLEAADPFAHGFPVDGAGALVALSPSLEGARAVIPRGGGSSRAGSGESCLTLARQQVARDGSAEVAVGLVVEDGRAWPHAWVRDRASGDAVDPSVLPDDPVLTRRRYLELPADRAGATYLELLTGKRRVALRAR